MATYNLTYEQAQRFNAYEALVNPGGQTWVGGGPQPTHTNQITIIATPIIYIRAGEELLLKKQQQQQKKDNK